MKTGALILATLLAASGTAFAQVTWVRQGSPEDSTSPGDSANVRTPRIQFFGAALGWALTPGGKLLKTLNGGQDWIAHPPPAGNLRAISFLNPDTGWVLAVIDTQTRDSDTTIVYNQKYLYAFRTFDGGTTWERGGKTPRNAQVSGPYSLHFTSPDSGWVFSGWAPFFRTFNGGQTWRESFGDQNVYYKSHVSRSGMIWVLTNRSLIKWDSVTAALENRRGIWAEVISFSEFKTTHAIFFADSNRGWNAGNGGIVRRTDDQGKTWTTLTGTGTQNALHALYFTDRDTGWALGDGGTARRTLNGGDSWEALSAPTVERLVAVDFADTRTGWAMGNLGSIFQIVGANEPASVHGASGARKGNDPRLSFAGGKLRYELDRAARVTVTLRTIGGARAIVVTDGLQPAGDHTLDIAVQRLSPGIHVITLDRDGNRSAKTVFIP
jgi:photosystem II stability/assembly factor-like uncharacterized protein